MSEIKVRDYVRSSSLGSYFGVGFNSPKDQFLLDTGQAVQEFDDDAQARMDLGNELEDAALNVFEKKLGFEITSRNIEIQKFLDGLLVGKVDGEMLHDEGLIVVENKISNAQSAFTDNQGYGFQIQAYLLNPKYTKALLCGLWQGKPVYKFIERDPEMQKDIIEMVQFVTSAMMGLVDFDEDFPTHLYEKYAKKAPDFLPLEDVSFQDVMDIEKLADVNTQIKALEKEKEILTNTLKDKFVTGRFVTDGGVSLSISEATRKGSYDVDLLRIDHPEIDWKRYTKPSSSYRMVKVTKK